MGIQTHEIPKIVWQPEKTKINKYKQLVAKSNIDTTNNSGQKSIVCMAFQM